MRNFAVIHRTGKIQFSRNWEPLERNIVIGFASSLPNLTRTLLHEEAHQVTGKSSRVVLQTSGHYIFLAHVDNSVPPVIVSNVLAELIGDIIDMMCTQGMSDACVALRGFHKTPIKYESRVRLDKLLVYLESIQGICNNASMLLVGNTVILSRFELEPSRQLLYFHKARPLRHNSVCFTPPGHAKGAGGGGANGSTSTSSSPARTAVPTPTPFHALHSEAPESITATGSTTVPLSTLLAKLTEFQSVFLYARLELPTEEKPVLLRQFAKREVLLFLHLHIKSGTVTFPHPRPLPEVQTRELYSTFWALFGEAKAAFATPGTREVTYAREVYRFHARADPEQEVYVMMAAEAVSMEMVGGHVGEIMMNLQRQQ
ncbi:hypothetical protein BCR44DRAFT_1429910 [Catenaria anguillulae PL171]|uniref:Uncharacterized protein n=1 Tax=Catenaria anguillulae PL171 TaxID=765915 RepID=A0A1Y2HUX7_9FUNG|nr:hypothetical protein BCR44DRAFT_1429910 [Catenaria anguillulae PL171]